MARPIYLDYNATYPIPEGVLRRVVDELSHAKLANPSATHAYGQNARALLEEARDHLTSIARIEDSFLVFTSGGSESNALALDLAISRKERPHPRRRRDRTPEPARARASPGTRRPSRTYGRRSEHRRLLRTGNHIERMFSTNRLRCRPGC